MLRIRHQTSGFTITECAVVAGLMPLILGTAVAALVHFGRSLHDDNLAAQNQMRLRHASYMLTKHLRLARYGIPVPDNQIGAWVDWVPGIDSNPWIRRADTADDPHELVVVGAFDPPFAVLAEPAQRGDLGLHLYLLGDRKPNTYDRKLLYVGNLELARVQWVSTDARTVWIDTAISGARKGLARSYEQGTPVELVSARVFRRVIDAEGGFHLECGEHCGYGIERLRSFAGVVGLRGIPEDDGTLRVEMIGAPLRHLTCPDGEGSPRLATTFRVTPRNSLP